MSSVRIPRIVETVSFRLTGLYALIFTGSVTVLAGTVLWAVEGALHRQIEARIDADIALLEAEFRLEGLEELILEIGERQVNILDDELDYLVVDAAGQRLAGNLPTLPDTVGWSDVAYSDGGESEERYRVRVVSLADGIRLAVGDDLRPIDDIKNATIRAFGWITLAVLALSVAGGLFISLGFFRRVDAINRTAESVIGGDLRERIPIRGTSDSLDRLSINLNRMLDRLAALMDSLRQVSSEIAHELRTPVTRLRNKLEAALDKTKTHGEMRSAIRAAIDETNEILRTFSALLRIAQVESGSRRAAFRPIDLSALFRTAVDDFIPSAEEEGKIITAEIWPGIVVGGDAELLTQMLANLLENAIRHTPKGTRIEVTLQSTASGAVGGVADDGPGVPAEHREHIFQRFYRLERSRPAPGGGLGLALVAAVADLHGIKLSAVDNAPGLRIEMRFEAPL